MGRPERVSREQVLRAAREAFGQRGYEATTLAGIASRLGVSAAALLRHAPTKEALFAEAMRSGEAGEEFPLEFLSHQDESEDPRVVLRRVVRALVPFIEAKIGETISRWMHARTAQDAREIARLISRPFGGQPLPPPERALAMLEEYFRRAGRSGAIRVREPRVAAVVFLGAVHSYVFLHKVLRLVNPPIPLERYIDTILEIWEDGAIRAKPICHHICGKGH
jgi:AcrR family transcriptional regulator